MSHKPVSGCEGCRNLAANGNCKTASHKDCVRWRTWFHKEWESIRHAAAVIKENNERKGSIK